MITRADIASPNLWIKFQSLESLMVKVSVEARGDKNMGLTSESCNAVIGEVQNRHIKSRPSVSGSTIFRFEKQNHYDTKSTLT